MNKIQCQIQCIPKLTETMGTVEVLWQHRKRIKRITKRRWNYLINLFSEIKGESVTISGGFAEKTRSYLLQPGDRVRIRSRQEIRATLDKWNQLRRCSFMEEMLPYCGTTQRVFKRVERFLDERDYLLKKCKGIVILEGIYCEGTKDFGQCDRSCFFFWREEWLEKI
jgi:hypothetical protein